MLRAPSQKSVVLSSSSHLVFFSSTRSSFPCLKVAISYKSGRFCAQLLFCSIIQSFPIYLLFTSDVIHCLRISLIFSRRLALRFHAFEWQLATSRPGLRSATTFRSTIPSSPIYLLFNSANLSSSSHLALFLVDSLFHYGILPSSLPSVYQHQRPLVFVCCRRLSRAP